MPSEQMAPAQTVVRDIDVRSADGLNLRGRWWRRPSPRAVAIVSHGFAEHGGCYRRVAEALGPALDLDIVAVDYRGHGRSPGRRGVVRRYDDLIGDLSSAIAWTARQLPSIPRYIIGHSNGGQVALRWALRHDDAIEGMVISNPALRIAVPIPPAKLKLGRLLARLAPWLTLPGDQRTGVLTRDPVIQAEHLTDTLRHNRISPPLFFGMVAGGEMLLNRASEIKIPLLMLLGGQDSVIDPAVTRIFYDGLGSVDKTLVIYPKMLHEPFNELGREQVFDDVTRWFDARFGDALTRHRRGKRDQARANRGPGSRRTRRLSSRTLRVAMTWPAVIPVSAIRSSTATAWSCSFPRSERSSSERASSAGWRTGGLARVGANFLDERPELLENVVNGFNQSRAIANQTMAAPAGQAIGRPRHREHLAVLLGRVAGRRERAAAWSRLDDEHAQREPRDDPVALREQARQRALTHRHFAHDRPGGGDRARKLFVFGRVDRCQPIGKHGDRAAPRLDRAAMSGRVNAARQS